MNISDTTAKDLIREISNIIDYDINIMNETGMIIASTDGERIGQFHEGAHRVIAKNLRELPVYYDGEYSGCKKGINLPLSMYDEIIGVIGITGEVEETSKYARLIKKITEILMKDLSIAQKHSAREQARILFVNGWLNGELDNSVEIESRLQEYHINTDRPIVVALIMSGINSDLVPEFLSSRVNPDRVLTSHNNNTGVIVGNFSSAEAMADYLNSCFDKEYAADQFICAAGSCYSEYEKAVWSFKEAQQVLRLKAGMAGGFYLYDWCHLDVILHQVSKYHKEQFVGRVFGQCVEADLPDFMDFIDTYYRNNGSINKIAGEMFVHKNTVQYKINKIFTQTGLDIRILKDQIRLRLAGIWYRELLRE